MDRTAPISTIVFKALQRGKNSTTAGYCPLLQYDSVSNSEPNFTFDEKCSDYKLTRILLKVRFRVEKLDENDRNV